MNGPLLLNKPTPRLRVSAVVGVALLVVALSTLAYYASWSWLPLPALPALPVLQPPASADGTSLPAAFATHTASYRGVPQVAAALPTPALPPTTGVPLPPTAPVLPSLALPTFPTPPPPPVTSRATPSPARAGTTPAPAKKSTWAYLAKADVVPGAASLQEDGPLVGTAVRGTPGRQSEHGGALIHPATWEIPAAPLKTLYRSQVLPGELLHPIQSDLPGQVHIRLTVPILDRFGYDTVILPKNSLIIAKQAGTPEYGQTRLKVTLEQIEFPSGEIVSLKASIDDADGSSGLSGKTNNHLGKLLLATGISAVLNIGAKSLAGTPGPNQYFKNPAQDAIEDVSHGVQQEAERVVSRELRVPPTIERKALTFCTIHLQENIQFNRPPRVVR